MEILGKAVGVSKICQFFEFFKIIDLFMLKNFLEFHYQFFCKGEQNFSHYPRRMSTQRYEKIKELIFVAIVVRGRFFFIFHKQPISDFCSLSIFQPSYISMKYYDFRFYR